MRERNDLVAAEVDQLLAATQDSRNAARDHPSVSPRQIIPDRYIRSNPAPPHRTPQRSMLGLSQQTAGGTAF